MVKNKIVLGISLFALMFMLFQCKSASPLSVASYNGNLYAVQERIDRGDNVNAYDGWGLTALMWACHYNNYDVAELLLQKGADPNLRSRLSYGSIGIGATALMIAAYQGHSMIVKLLLNHNAIKTVKDASGYTVERYARAGGNQKVIDIIKQ